MCLKCQYCEAITVGYFPAGEFPALNLDDLAVLAFAQIECDDSPIFSEPARQTTCKLPNFLLTRLCFFSIRAFLKRLVAQPQLFVLPPKR